MQVNVKFLDVYGTPTTIEHSTQIEVHILSSDAKLLAQALGKAIGEAISHSQDSQSSKITAPPDSPAAVRQST